MRFSIECIVKLERSFYRIVAWLEVYEYQICLSMSPTNLSSLQKPHCIQGFLYVWYLVLQTSRSSLCIDFHELILALEIGQLGASSESSVLTYDIISWKLFIVPSTSAIEET